MRCHVFIRLLACVHTAAGEITHSKNLLAWHVGVAKVVQRMPLTADLHVVGTTCTLSGIIDQIAGWGKELLDVQSNTYRQEKPGKVRSSALVEECCCCHYNYDHHKYFVICVAFHPCSTRRTGKILLMASVLLQPRRDPKGLDPSNVVIGEVVPPLDGAAAHFSAMSPPATSHASAASDAGWYLHGLLCTFTLH